MAVYEADDSCCTGVLDMLTVGARLRAERCYGGEMLQCPSQPRTRRRSAIDAENLSRILFRFVVTPECDQAHRSRVHRHGSSFRFRSIRDHAIGSIQCDLRISSEILEVR